MKYLLVLHIHYTQCTKQHQVSQSWKSKYVSVPAEVMVTDTELATKQQQNSASDDAFVCFACKKHPYLLL